MACRQEKRELLLSPETNMTKPEAKDTQDGRIMMGSCRVTEDNPGGQKSLRAEDLFCCLTCYGSQEIS